MEFLNKVEAHQLNYASVWLPADSIAISTLIWPELIISKVPIRMTVVTCSSDEGKVKFDRDSADKNVELITKFDIEKLKILLHQNL